MKKQMIPKTAHLSGKFNLNSIGTKHERKRETWWSVGNIDKKEARGQRHTDTEWPPKTPHITEIIICKHSGYSDRRGWVRWRWGRTSSTQPQNLWLTLKLQWPQVIYWGQTETITAGLQTREGASDCLRVTKHTNRSHASEALLSYLDNLHKWKTTEIGSPGFTVKLVAPENQVTADTCDIQFNFTCLETKQDAFSFLGIICHYKYHNVAEPSSETCSDNALVWCLGCFCSTLKCNNQPLFSVSWDPRQFRR